MGSMRVMGSREWFEKELREVAQRHPTLAETQWKSGDTKLVWDPLRPSEVEAVEDLFKSLKDKGYQAFGVKADGEKGEMISSFDPSLGKIIMVPAMRGG